MFHAAEHQGFAIIEGRNHGDTGDLIQAEEHVELGEALFQRKAPQILAVQGQHIEGHKADVAGLLAEQAVKVHAPSVGLDELAIQRDRLS